MTASLCLCIFVFVIYLVSRLDALFLLACLVNSYIAFRTQQNALCSRGFPNPPESACLPPYHLCSLYGPLCQPHHRARTGSGSLGVSPRTLSCWKRKNASQSSLIPELCLAQSSGPGNVCLLSDITKLFHRCLWNEGRDFLKGDWCCSCSGRVRRKECAITEAMGKASRGWRDPGGTV